MGFRIEFEGKTKYVKDINTKTGTPFKIGQVNAYVDKVGYVNMGFKAFGEVAEAITDEAFVHGVGMVSLNSRDRNKMEITIDGIEYCDEEEVKNSVYSSRIQLETSVANRPEPKQKEKPKPKEKKSTDDFFKDLGLDEDDMPF